MGRGSAACSTMALSGWHVARGFPAGCWEDQDGRRDVDKGCLKSFRMPYPCDVFNPRRDAPRGSRYRLSQSR